MSYDWPSLSIGLLIALYWYRVLRKAWHTKKRTGRAANIMPAEPIGRFLRIIWYPVVFIWIAHPIAQGLKPQLRMLFDLPMLRWSALAVAVLAFIATLVCWKRMGRSWRMGIDPAEKTALVVRGPWAYVRHPIYSLSILLMLCTMVILPTPLMLAAGVIHIAFLI
jgi:protein-S-isoprenylcysteine O-methyltransferase Ste14